MNMTRRFFMTTAPAAPLAAPDLVKAAMDAQPWTQPPIGYAVGLDNSPDWNYLRQRRERLEKVIRGETDECEKYVADITVAVARHYDGMRSLSPIMRQVFYDQVVAKKRRQREIESARFELDDLIKRFLK